MAIEQLMHRKAEIAPIHFVDAGYVPIMGGGGDGSVDTFEIVPRLPSPVAGERDRIGLFAILIKKGIELIEIGPFLHSQLVQKLQGKLACVGAMVAVAAPARGLLVVFLFALMFWLSHVLGGCFYADGRCILVRVF